MCQYMQATLWACQCRIRPTHRVPLDPFMRQCADYGTSCSGPNTLRWRPGPVPTLCPECHSTLIQTQLRPLYGLTGSTVSAVQRQLDRVDINVDTIGSEILPARNQLDAALTFLDANIIRVTRLLNRARDVALEAYFGNEVFTLLGLAKHAEDGQEYPFLDPSITKHPSMLTLGEQREANLPSFSEEEPIQNPYPRLIQSPQSSPPPNYIGLFPANNLGPVQPASVEANRAALEEQEYASDESDDEGGNLTKIEILVRLREKLQTEMRQLEKQLRQPPTGNPYSAAQRARHNDPGLDATSAAQRRKRVRQIKKQRKVLSSLIGEEQRLVALNRTMLGNAQGGAETSAVVARMRLKYSISAIYRNRWNHSLSEVLVPMNATNSSRVHRIHLLPEALVQAFEPRTLGFSASVEDQLEAYTTNLDDLEASEASLSDESDSAESEEEDENNQPSSYPETQHDPTAAPRERPQLPGPPLERFVPPTQLRHYDAVEDSEMPRIRHRRDSSGIMQFGLAARNPTPVDPVDVSLLEETEFLTELVSALERPTWSEGLQPADIAPETRLHLLDRIRSLRTQPRSSQQPSGQRLLLPSESHQLYILLDPNLDIWDNESLVHLVFARSALLEGVPESADTERTLRFLDEFVGTINALLLQNEAESTQNSSPGVHGSVPLGRGQNLATTAAAAPAPRTPPPRDSIQRLGIMEQLTEGLGRQQLQPATETDSDEEG